MSLTQIIEYIKKGLFATLAVVLALYFFVILLTYSTNDPSWSHISSDMVTINNIGGVAGAWISDFLYLFLGLSAWWLVVIFLYEACSIWWSEKKVFWLIRLVGYVFLLLSSSALFSLMSIKIGLQQHDVFGGIVGYELSARLVQLLSKFGAFLFLTVFLWLTVTFTFNIRWIETFQRLFGWVGKRTYKSKLNAEANIDEQALEETQMADTKADERQAESLAEDDHPYGQLPLKMRPADVKPPVAQPSPAERLQAYLYNTGLSSDLKEQLAQQQAAEASLSAKEQSSISAGLTQQSSTSSNNTTQKPTLSTDNSLPESHSFSKRHLTDHKIEPKFAWNDTDVVDDLLGENQINHDTASPNLNQTEPKNTIETSVNTEKTFANKTALSDDTRLSTSDVLDGDSRRQTIQIERREPMTSRMVHIEDYSSHDEATPFQPTWQSEAAWQDEPILLVQNTESLTFAEDTDAQKMSLDSVDVAFEEISTDEDFAQPTFSQTANIDQDEPKQLTELTEAFLERESLSQNKIAADEADIQEASLSKFYGSQEAVVAGYAHAVQSVSINTNKPAAQSLAQKKHQKNQQKQVSQPNTFQRSYQYSMPAMTPKNTPPANPKEPPKADIEQPSTPQTESEFKPFHHPEASSYPEQNQASKPKDWDILDENAFTGKSRAMQTAEYRASLSKIPELSLLDKLTINDLPSYSDTELQQMSELLEIKLQEFNVKATVIKAIPGPVVTRFEVELAAGVKVSKVTGISRDLARSLSMPSLRVVEVIPGKPYIGIEIPNKNRQKVRLIELLETQDYQDKTAQISVAMGKDIGGKPVITDLAKAPHMLVAGTTGSGKSVLVNAILLSMLLKYTPEQLRLILIDPKQLELANYNDIPHLLTPVVTDMTEAASSLSWCVAEMERRYQLMSLLKVRKVAEFNKKVVAAEQAGRPIIDPLWRPNDSVSIDKAPKLKTLPLIVIVADEFADMIMQVGKQAEELITRLAQKSRASGIHLILATQRPSVDVITGLIKANIPVRAALRVNSKVDSRTILDTGGAEDMLGYGDMLFLGPGKIEPERVHGAFISDDEVNRVCDAWRERGRPDYIDNMTSNFELTPPDNANNNTKVDDNDLYDQAISFVLETGKPSASSLQRKFSIGYNKAARLMDRMEEDGVVTPMDKSGKRHINR